MGRESVCYERDYRGSDGGGALFMMRAGPSGRRAGADFNRGKRRRSRVVVVSVASKGGAGLRQVRIKKTNTSEPLMTCRKTVNGVEPGSRLYPAKQVEGYLSTAPLTSTK